MEIQKVKGADNIYAVNNPKDTPVLRDAQSALDLIGTVCYQYPGAKLVIEKKDVAPEFFDLKTGIAGEVLQKFVNYHVAMAIVGDFSEYTSKSLKDFIYESNKGKAIFFVGSEAEAVARLDVAD